MSSPNWAEVLVAIAAAVGVIVAIIGVLSTRSRAALSNSVRAAWSSFLKKKAILRDLVTTITAIMLVAVFFTTKRLPTAGTIEKTVKKVGNKIAATNMVSLGARMDNIIHAIINYQKDPDATRNRVYEDALKQAAGKGYVFYIPQRDYYITAIKKRNDDYLLTKEERDRIKNSLDDIFKRSNKRDQMSLMNEVISDIRVTKELWIPKERLADLSTLDLIGVVGGYIGELILEQ